ncbi:MAG: putative entry exclusion protein TrbK-alt [Stellaceae bacterium]
MRAHGSGTVAPFTAFAAIAVAIAVTAVNFPRTDKRPEHSGGTVTSTPRHPLVRDLAHRHGIGVAAKEASACEAAWAENWHRIDAGAARSQFLAGIGVGLTTARDAESREAA